MRVPLGENTWEKEIKIRYKDGINYIIEFYWEKPHD